MLKFSDLKFMYTHPRVRITQGKAKARHVDWSKIRVTVRHDFKNPKVTSKVDYKNISLYKEDLEEFLNNNPACSVRIKLPISFALIVQNIIDSYGDENTYVRVRNDFEYIITIMVKEKNIFNENFRAYRPSTPKDGKPTMRPVGHRHLEDLLFKCYNMTKFDDYQVYTVLNTSSISKHDNAVNLSETQVKSLKQLSLYKRANYIEVPINTNQAKLLSFINIGETIWD